jgi:hypothetical protein
MELQYVCLSQSLLGLGIGWLPVVKRCSLKFNRKRPLSQNSSDSNIHVKENAPVRKEPSTATFHFVKSPFKL